MNRLLGLLPRRSGEAIAIAPTVPLALRGPAEVDVLCALGAAAGARRSAAARRSSSTPSDAQLHALWSTAMDARGMAGAVSARPEPGRARPARGQLPGAPGRPAHRDDRDRRLGHPQRARRRAWPNQLKALDAMLAALRDGLGAGVGRHDGAGRHRVRPHRRGQRHRRHRPRHRVGARCCSAARVKGGRVDRRLAGARAGGPVSRPRSEADARRWTR